MAEYTKGKHWEIRQLPTRFTSDIVVYNNGEYIATVAEFVNEANAQLIVSAVNSCISLNKENPLAIAEGMEDIIEACKAQHQAIDILFAKLIALDQSFFPSKSGLPWDAVVLGNQALTSIERGK